MVEFLAVLFVIENIILSTVLVQRGWQRLVLKQEERKKELSDESQMREIQAMREEVAMMREMMAEVLLEASDTRRRDLDSAADVPATRSPATQKD